MKIKEIVRDHLYHLIINYIRNDDYVTKHTIVTFIPPLLHYLHERMRFDIYTDYLYNMMIFAFHGVVRKLQSDIYLVQTSVINWVFGDDFTLLLKKVICDVIIDKKKTFKVYDIVFVKDTRPMNEMIAEIAYINMYIEKNNKEYKKIIKRVYYKFGESPENFYA